MNLGLNIKLARGKKSQTQLAEELSISISTLNSYEKDRVLPPTDVFISLCMNLGISADEIFGIKKVEETPRNSENSLGGRLFNLRQRSDKSQAEMAILIDVDASTWARYESGSRVPDLKKIKKICMATEVSADYLLKLPPRQGEIS